MAQLLTFDGHPLHIEDVTAISRRELNARLSGDSTFLARIEAGAAHVARTLAEQGVIYGVTTGYGDSVTTPVPPELVPELGHRLFTYHGVGLGPPFGIEETRAILAARLQSLSQGLSGVSVVMLRQLERLLVDDLLPVIPQEGSVGASGDLTPLSYVAAVLCGERDVFVDGVRTPTAEVFKARGIAPIQLKPKEGLAIMNGTAVMTGLACLAFERAEGLSRLSAHLTAMASAAMGGNPHHFDERLFQAKPHVGQQRVAGWIRADLAGSERSESRLQDRYSIRCAPHVIGVLEDTLPFLRSLIENELNSANDNPLIDPEDGRVMHGGHFYGGHIALAMDTLKNVVANLADLMDRQIALLVDTRFNHGLPANLSGATGQRASVSHGLKALQIGASAWAAEALKLTMPASVFSRSTECHNQDKVSMGTIAARDALRVLTLTEQVAAAHVVTARQAVFLKARSGAKVPAGVLKLAEQMGVEPLIEDRVLEPELRGLIARMPALGKI
ncbi:MAG: aromatic amino acid ammonia-lyase [Archangium sp.]|nr:aromatic amino acid ammonia-lyase [Archangium sp.]MDP3157560.1 aromatic amino acid ammonia-lyase [Archangium sp.]MDP3571960.1 aromatic amino acid ammonia-lyase [Archangium sp.]